MCTWLKQVQIIYFFLQVTRVKCVHICTCDHRESSLCHWLKFITSIPPSAVESASTSTSTQWRRQFLSSGLWRREQQLPGPLHFCNNPRLGAESWSGEAAQVLRKQQPKGRTQCWPQKPPSRTIASRRASERISGRKPEKWVASNVWAHWGGMQTVCRPSQGLINLSWVSRLKVCERFKTSGTVTDDASSRDDQCEFVSLWPILGNSLRWTEP